MAIKRCGRLPVLNLLVALGALAWAIVLDSGNKTAADWRQIAPWCAYLGGQGFGYDCSYYTFEQCMATARGLGGSCSPNPRLAFDPDRPRRRVRR